MRWFVLNCGKKAAGIAVDTVDTELVRPGPLRRGLVCLRWDGLNGIKTVGMVVKPHSIAQMRLVSRSRDLAEFSDYISYVVSISNRS